MSPRPEKLQRSELALALATLVFAGIGWFAWQRPSGTDADPATEGIPVPLAKHVGRVVTPLKVVAPAADGAADTVARSPQVVYLFATTCGYCEAQRAHIGKLLAAVSGDAEVLTASAEPLARTSGYWRTIAPLSAPVQLTPETSARLALPGVPALLFLRRDGSIATAAVGSALRWTVDSLRRRIVPAATGDRRAAGFVVGSPPS